MQNKTMQAIELKKILSANLKRFRKSQGLSQFALAEKAEISEDTIKSIELLRQWPSEKTLVQIAEALNIDVFKFFLPEVKNISLDTKKSKEIKKIIAQNLQNYVDEVLKGMVS